MVFKGGKGTFVSGRLSWSYRLGVVAGELSFEREGLTMTKNGNLKRRVRARSAKTGESYTTALMHVRGTPPSIPIDKTLRLAVAQTTLLTILAIRKHFESAGWKSAS